MLTMWNPYSDWGFGNLRRTLAAMDALRREMNQALGSADREEAAEPSETAWGGWPRSAMRDAGDRLVVWAEVPGLAEKDLEVTVTANAVTIRGERKADAPANYTVHRKERSNVSFSRSFVLPAKVDADKAEARVTQGVLELSLPKVAEARPRQIAVKAS
jgi:HSP20 family protein